MTTTAPATTTPAPTPAPAATSSSPTLRRLWHRSRWYLAAAAFLALVGLLVGGLNGGSRWPDLDPRSPDPNGTRAAIRLLERQGVAVRTTEDEKDLAAALRTPATTVVLPRPDLLSADRLRSLGSVPRATATRLVLIAPQQPALDSLAPGLHLETTTSGLPYQVGLVSTDPVCPEAEANRAGRAELGGFAYRPRPTDTACYPRNGRPTLVHRTADGDRETVVLGTGYPLTNDRLDDDGNASLALGLLGARPNLLWYLPDRAAPAPAAERDSFADHIPSGWNWAALQLAVAAVLAALWRARRLGPVVSERLPVVVRAAETTEGRARLYRRAGARDRAADALRRAVRHRISPVLGVPLTGGEPEPTALCAAVSARLDRPAADLQHLLYGPAPTDDAALLRLTADLDALERQVRQP
ncbi:DUF4350 domain-containing protein [Kitasatospora camelliae]|uniref:DUF4350 domain-containing protein n=1 Tax=Kitasatospora camelliae TaxID=3156397 RepID=A0AAU8JXM4_9ACTN